ncbi:MAG TPA: ABC transporter ATP-binding protein [Candidatus Elarobacter sp.]|jgi:putative ABC transport system ATP-binding protein|nr:ABC transporter ATP-binding protein [Candidatus Elarobacter sp.]
MTRLIEARNASREFDEGRVAAVRGINLAIDEGDFVAIEGPSGSGKSTLLQLIGALERPTAGEFYFAGTAYAEMPDLPRFRAHTIGFIFQSFHLLPTLSALENVQIPMFEMGWGMRERRERARRLLERMGLADRMDHFPATLSGGERQRVAIARSLANEPKVLLADEPTGNLDSASAGRVMQLLVSINKEQRMTLIVVTHDLSVASHADYVVRMLDGTVTSDSRMRPVVS